MSQNYDSKIEESQVELEKKTDLTDGQHIALAIHRLADLFEEFLEATIPLEEREED